MQMIPVKSSNIKAAGHEANTMRVEFTNGTVYDYPGVSAELFNNFMQAESQGRYYHQFIKGKFNGTRVEKDKENGQGKM